MDRAPLPIAPAALAAGRIAVAGHVLDLSCGDLFTADGTPAALRHKALELLLVLGEHAGQVIGKDELMRRVWPRVVVTEDSLTQAVAAIRRVLGDARHEWLRTRPRRGYMLVSGGEAAAAPRMPAPRSRTLLLPAPDSSLIGRDDDLAALCARVAEGRLVTLAGAGGIGKTRLALAAAHALAGRFYDGVAWVDLAPLHDAARVPAAIATAAGVELAGPDASRALMADSPDAACCSCSTTASTWPAPRQRLPGACARGRPRCTC